MQHWPETIAAQVKQSEQQAFRAESNTLYPITDQAIIEVKGPDAEKFLQGQLSADIAEVTLTKSGLATHSTAKGRMISSGRLYRAADDCFYYMVHRSISDSALTALKKYIKSCDDVCLANR